MVIALTLIIAPAYWLKRKGLSSLWFWTLVVMVGVLGAGELIAVLTETVTLSSLFGQFSGDHRMEALAGLSFAVTGYTLIAAHLYGEVWKNWRNKQ